MRNRLTYSVEQAAALLGISRTKAYESIRTGKLHAVPLGRRLVVPAHVVDAVLGLGERQARPLDVINEVELAGRLTGPSEEHATANGTRMVRFRLAVGGRERPVFIDVLAFGGLAQQAVNLTKGQRAWVAGRIDQRDWTTADGLRRSNHQIVARCVEALEPPRSRPVPPRTT